MITQAEKEALGTEEGKNAYTNMLSDELEDTVKEKGQANYNWSGKNERESRKAM